MYKFSSSRTLACLLVLCALCCNTESVTAARIGTRGKAQGRRRASNKDQSQRTGSKQGESESQSESEEHPAALAAPVLAAPAAPLIIGGAAIVGAGLLGVHAYNNRHAIGRTIDRTTDSIGSGIRNAWNWAKSKVQPKAVPKAQPKVQPQVKPKPKGKQKCRWTYAQYAAALRSAQGAARAFAACRCSPSEASARNEAYQRMKGIKKCVPSMTPDQLHARIAEFVAFQQARLKAGKCFAYDSGHGKEAIDTTTGAILKCQKYLPRTL
jgi:hypothetical protein